MSAAEFTSSFDYPCLVWETKRPFKDETRRSPVFAFKKREWYLELRVNVKSNTYDLSIVSTEQRQIFLKFAARTWFLDLQQNDTNRTPRYFRQEITSAITFLACVNIADLERITTFSTRGFLRIVCSLDEIGSSAQHLELGDEDVNQHPRSIQTSSQNHVVRPSTRSQKSVKWKDGGLKKQNIIRPRQDSPSRSRSPRPSPSRSPSPSRTRSRNQSTSGSRNPSTSLSPSPCTSQNPCQNPSTRRSRNPRTSQSPIPSTSRSRNPSTSRSPSQNPSTSRSPSPSLSIQSLRIPFIPWQESSSPSPSRSQSPSPLVQGLRGRQPSTRKHLNFVTEPIGKKTVYQIPGVGAVGGWRFEEAGYTEASSVLGAYLAMDTDEMLFMDWLENDIGLSKRRASECYRAFLEWSYEYI